MIKSIDQNLASGPTINKETSATRSLSTPKKLRFASLRNFTAHLQGQYRLLVVALVASLGATACSVMQPLVVREMTNAITSGDTFRKFVVILVIVALTSATLNSVQYYLLQHTAETVILNLRRRLVCQLFSLPIQQFDQRRTGDLMSRVGADTTMMRTVITSGLFDIVSAVLMFSAAVVLMLLIDATLFGITFIAVATGAVGTTLLGSHVRRKSRAVQDSVGSMSAAVERGLSGIRTIKASGSEEHEAEAVGREAVLAHRAGVAMARLQSVVQPLMTTCIQGAFLIVLVIGSARLADGTLVLGDLMAFILYLFLLVTPVASAMGALIRIQSGFAAMDRIHEIAVLETERSDEGSLFDMSGHELSSNPATITFSGVYFEYRSELENKEFRVLEDVSFVVPAGTRTAIVGPSGAGKSTLLALLERFYEPTCGSILYDGISIDQIPRDVLRSRLALLEQEAPVLSGTLADNLRISAPSIGEREMKKALEEVGLVELIYRSSRGLDLDLGENGIRLSGGQRQRLGWARIILANRPVLLMDEPTSAVDPHAEDMLKRTLTDSSKDQTVILLTHRLSTVTDFDQIVLLSEGKVVAIGKHSELLVQSPLYRDMAERQLLLEH